MTDIQARHAPAVLAGELQLASNWGEPDLGYVLLFRPDAAASAGLAELQRQVHAVEPSLLRQPRPQLHASIAWLLAVDRDFGQPKDELWADRGDDWVKIIGVIADAAEPMRIRYRRLVVTDGAIIAVAEEPNPVAAFRRGLTGALGLSWPITYSSLGIVHSTLFRYRKPLSDPAGLLRWLEPMRVAVETEVSEVLMVRESCYPMLAYEILHRLPLRGGRT